MFWNLFSGWRWPNCCCSRRAIGGARVANNADATTPLLITRDAETKTTPTGATDTPFYKTLSFYIRAIIFGSTATLYGMSSFSGAMTWLPEFAGKGALAVLFAMPNALNNGFQVATCPVPYLGVLIASTLTGFLLMTPGTGYLAAANESYGKGWGEASIIPVTEFMALGLINNGLRFLKYCTGLNQVDNKKDMPQTILRELAYLGAAGCLGFLLGKSDILAARKHYALDYFAKIIYPDSLFKNEVDNTIFACLLSAVAYNNLVKQTAMWVRTLVTGQLITPEISMPISKKMRWGVGTTGTVCVISSGFGLAYGAIKSPPHGALPIAQTLLGSTAILTTNFGSACTAAHQAITTIESLRGSTAEATAAAV
jgi:hypothetical protein